MSAPGAPTSPADLRAFASDNATVVIGTSLTFSLYLNGAQKIGGAKAGILSCAEPLSSALLSLLLLGITFTLPDWLGTLLILSSVVLIAMDSRRRVKTA